ncbi:MAG: cephalosporin hydroxylase family protein [Phycisphaeraceae bacterium]|nr:cephalosporin hydroxylase family protein [Phycisphaeraceae bacterium]
MSDPVREFEDTVRENTRRMAGDTEYQKVSSDWMTKATVHKYPYGFRWMGRPIIQLPQDIIAMQEVIWQTQPDLIIETGIAHGGSLIFNASMLELLGNDGRVLGIDIDIRAHNRAAIESHPMSKRIDMIEGSSIDQSVADQVKAAAQDRERVMVVLDSNHTHEHVLRELDLYSPLVTKGCYLLVFDSLIEDLAPDLFKDRPWGPGNNPKTAAWEFLKSNDRFVIDQDVEQRLLLTVAPDGYLRCVKD